MGVSGRPPVMNYLNTMRIFFIRILQAGKIMGFVDWKQEYNLDIGIIDKQHQMLVTMINELHAAMTGGRDRAALEKIIGRLSVYAAMHFAREEHYFHISGYVEASDHEKQHSDFEATIGKFENDFKEGRQDLTIEIINFLVDWLIGHINGSDRKYAPFLVANGIE